jgi:CelD/BcsL family acetyltransferase involved in cellulose biosynthesis
MRNHAEYKTIRTTDELEACVPRWQSLWEQDSNATPFQSPAWLLPWWHQFGQPELRAVAIEQDNQWIGFVPLYIYREPRTGERLLLPLGIGTTDYLDGVFAPPCTEHHILNALKQVWESEQVTEGPGCGWDTIVFSQLRDNSKLYLALARAPELPLQRFNAESCSRMPALRIADLPQKIRRNAMYYRNRAQRLGRLELTVAVGPDCRETFEALHALHTTRWQDRGEPGVLADPRVLGSHREALPLLLKSGTLRLCSLRLNSDIIGVLYALVDPPSRPHRTLYCYLTAYSTQHAELRPGTLLLAYAVERAAEEGINTIDNLRGNEPYKQIWHMNAFPTFGFIMSRTAYQGPDRQVAA